MSPQVDRRRFLELSAAAGAALAVQSSAQAVAANEKVIVAVMGVHGRGSALAKAFSENPGSEVAYVIDVDEQAVDKTVKLVESVRQRRPQGAADVRKVLEDKAVDALVIAAPNHWHAPATILACGHGKHVYCEKPCSHNAREGELMVQAARKNNVVVQHGTQRRSWPAVREAIEQVQSGAIGKVLHVRSWYNNRRPSIGHGNKAEVPSWLNWSLWQGPAPERDYLDNIVHYNWHWRWHWGGGELANNGVHGLDVCRWGLGVDYPNRVAAMGGHYRWDDDQETPDTLTVTYEFDGATIMWEGVSWSSRGRGDDGFGVEFLGENGTLAIKDSSYQIFDEKNKPIPGKSGTGRGGDPDHVANFLECVRSGSRPNADVEDAHKSTLLCHLGNISYRTGRVLECDPKTGRVKNVPEAEELWSREYRKDWEPKV
jgi:predicted dehydrogenase